MFFFLLSCFSFILLSKYSSFLRPLPARKSEMRMFLGELSLFFVSWFKTTRIPTGFFQLPTNKAIRSNAEEICLLDLPDLALECILQRLSPTGLISMAGVCCSLRNWCRSDRLWDRHLKQKWGTLIGEAAYREWQSQNFASRNKRTLLNCANRKGLFGHLSSVWPLNRLKVESSSEQRSSLPVDSIMAWYLSLENGKFWLPAQVYNREVQNGNVGFMLSCYDAELCYDSRTDTFRARYSAQGRPIVEDNIEWNRLRAPVVDTPAHVLHVSVCLNDLKPKDHIEIQWRRSKEFPYGWWYGVVGHLEQCDGNKLHCRCHSSDTVILEFKQFAPGSRWRQVVINRKDHREVGNETNGFYGGIRKLHYEEDISLWKGLWPTQLVE